VQQPPNSDDDFADLLEGGRAIYIGRDYRHTVHKLTVGALMDKADKEADKGTERHLLALDATADFLLAAHAPPEMVTPLWEIIDYLVDAMVAEWTRDQPGRKPQRFTHRIAMAAFAAAVTVLKKDRSVEGAIADIAIANNISRKAIKNFRDRLNRGRSDDLSNKAYKVMLANYEGKSRAEIMQHAELLKGGRKDGKPLAPGTVRLAHQVLRKSLARAVNAEVLGRNVATLTKAPAGPDDEVEILDAGQITEVLAGLEGHWLHPIAVLALATGARRGELLALRWSNIDLDKATMSIEQSLEETASGGLRFKSPKNRQSKRTISLPASAVSMLRTHRKEQLELHMQLGIRTDLVFVTINGDPRGPDYLTTEWRRVTSRKKLPQVKFHAMRHTHASALIASGIDVVTVSRRLGHANPTITEHLRASVRQDPTTPRRQPSTSCWRSRPCTHKPKPNADLDLRPTSGIGGKADMARACHYVR
jgi:integrase